jgi:hypothetical protein
MAGVFIELARQGVDHSSSKAEESKFPELLQEKERRHSGQRKD